MNRAELQKMAEKRIEDAKALLEGGRWEFAYYAAGYAVECALKSCLLTRMVHTGWVFEEKWQAKDCLTHDFRELIRLAGLKAEHDNLSATNATFVVNWGTVAQWKVTSRYESKSEQQAGELYAAIADDPDGVLQWIRTYW